MEDYLIALRSRDNTPATLLRMDKEHEGQMIDGFRNDMRQKIQGELLEWGQGLRTSAVLQTFIVSYQHTSLSCPYWKDGNNAFKKIIYTGTTLNEQPLVG